ncbi:MAG: ATP-dependent sacrificial sulfur transferase LarE [Sulfurospirillum sp.]|nr:ATP-dependent sacrificial sulfur transferase LarE [Sulfurospirillum sp.]
MYAKYEKLKAILASYKRMIVAFSGGVDSSFLLKTAYDVLGENVLAISLQTPYSAKWEMEDARCIADEMGAKHLIMSKPWIEAIQTNPENRCYLCKHALFSSLNAFAKERGFCVVAEGSNVDDTMEYRPGRKALEQLGIVTPLLEARLRKDEIRILSKELGLKTWNKPSYACLLTRFAHNILIEEEALDMVERAEAYLISETYAKMRVRYEHKMARIEMSKKRFASFVE